MPDWREDVKERFRVNYDSVSGVFRLLDLWHESVVSLPLDTTIPDDSPAMKILSTLEVNSLLNKLKQMGWLDKMFGPGEQIATTSMYPKKDIKEIAIENVTRVVELSADNGVSKEAILAIEKIANEIKSIIANQEMSELSGENPELQQEVIKKGPGRPRKET